MAKGAFGQRLSHTPVVAAYWFVSARGEFRRAEVALDHAEIRLDDVLRVIVDGIEHGVFLVQPRTARRVATSLAHLRRPRHPWHA